MKTKHFLSMTVMSILIISTAIAQNDMRRNPSEGIIPFGRKLSAHDFTGRPGLPPGINNFDLSMPPTQGIKKDLNRFKEALEYYMQKILNLRRQQLLPSQKNQASVFKNENAASLHSGFHLTRDINALAESNPSNKLFYFPSSGTTYAILNDVIYFAADDGINGNELWRSDGSNAGTFMVKDIAPGAASSPLFNITGVNGKLYFSALPSSPSPFPRAWVSDGTENGTRLLLPFTEGHQYFFGSFPSQFVQLGKSCFFITDGDFYFSNALWKTDGTPEGTVLVKDFSGGDFSSWGYAISSCTSSNGLLFFSINNFTYGDELWRSDGTDTGTYLLKDIGPGFQSGIPTQLTSQNNKLYFAANDGSGRKLWVTDGTSAGTTYAPGNNDVQIDAEIHLESPIRMNIPFAIVNNVLYIPGTSLSTGSALYKYDASGTEGLQLVKDLTPGTDSVFIVTSEMKVADNTIYFKVFNSTGGGHDELWKSKGGLGNTVVVKQFLPGETISGLYNGSGTLYFVKRDAVYGSELWKTNGTAEGTLPVSDIFEGITSSYPENLTALKGKLFFSAADEIKGNELFVTDGSSPGTALVKDINTARTTSSNASSLAALKHNVVFGATERMHGISVYISDGTTKRTSLLHDIIPGEGDNIIGRFLSKNDQVYFQAFSSNYSIYKTNGKKDGLKKITPDYDASQHFIVDFKVADNGLVFYEMFNNNTSSLELWRSDGTAHGTFLLLPALSFFNYLNVTGNTAFFTGEDEINGFELWKSDGSIAGTKIVKDINPGPSSSDPKGFFIYKYEVYFAAIDDASFNYSFWKSDGTEKGTVKLANTDLWVGNYPFESPRFSCVSNNILYFFDVKSNLWKTNGTASGTKFIKRINTTTDDFSLPVYSNLTDVDGTVFFTIDDVVHGFELWKSDGTTKGTQLVKDISPGIYPSYLHELTSFEGKLFFTKETDGVNLLWSSDGTAQGTQQVSDEGLSDVSDVRDIEPAGHTLFLSAYSSKYGYELYAGRVDNKTATFSAARNTYEPIAKTISGFNVLLYPNPVASKATLQITGNAKIVNIAITDINGKKLWQGSKKSSGLINLPAQKLAAGSYIVTVTSGTESKIIKFVKQ